MSVQRPGNLHRVLVRVALAVALVWTVVPLVWMVLSSLKSSNDLTADPPKVAFHPTLDHYRALFSGGTGIGGYVAHSIVAAGVSTIIAVTLGCLAGYGLSRSRFRG